MKGSKMAESSFQARDLKPIFNAVKKKDGLLRSALDFMHKEGPSASHYYDLHNIYYLLEYALFSNWCKQEGVWVQGELG